VGLPAQVVLPAVAVILFWRYRGANARQDGDLGEEIVDAKTAGRPRNR
jgi:hypothetical protein